MDRDFCFSRVFKVVAKHSNKAIDVYRASKDNGKAFYPQNVAQLGNVIQYNYQDADNQQVLLFPMDDNTFVIAFKHSGKVLDVARASRSDKANVIQYIYNGGNHQRFSLVDVGAQYFKVMAKHSGKVLDIYGASRENKANIIQYREHGGDNQCFFVSQVGNYSIPSKSTIQSLGDIPRFEDFTDQLPEQTAPITVGEVFLPFFMVNDSIDRDIAINSTPYYKLTHQKCWKKLYQNEYTGDRENVFEESYTYGMQRTKTISMTKTVKMELKSDFGFKFAKLSIGLSNTITSELKITQSVSEEVSEEKNIKEKVTFPYGERKAFAKYAVLSRFSLERADGVKIAEDWEVVNNSAVRHDGWPNRESPEPVKTDTISEEPES